MLQNKIFKKILTGVLVALVWIGLWQIVYITIDREVLIASPLSVFVRLFELLRDKEFYVKVLNSLYAILKGYVLALFLGTVLAIITSKSKLLYAVFKPFVNIVKATPVASFIILALVWMTKSNVPVFTSFLMVMPITWSNISTGIKSTDRSLIEMAKSYKMSKSKVLSKILIPSVMPQVYNSITTGIGFAWKSGVAAEVLSTPVKTIGTELYNSKVYLETVDLFAWTVVIIILSMLLEKVFVNLLKYTVKNKFGGDIL